MGEEPHRSDRGGGIHVEGDFRVRGFHLVFNAETGELVSPPLVPEVRTDTLHAWLHVSAQAADDAEGGRIIAAGAAEDDSVTFREGLEREFRASLIAIAAAAFAGDAFYGSVIQHAPETRVAARPRNRKIFETLKRAFSLSGNQLSALDEHLRLIFRLRDEAVHPPAEWAEPILHPAFNLGMEPRLVKYRQRTPYARTSSPGR